MKKIFATILLIFLVATLVACSFAPVDTTKFDKQNVKVIAHRGLSGLEMENTNSAFLSAGQRTYFGIEADVRKTADGKFIICHDETLLRISGKNVNVENSLYQDLMDVVLFGGERLADLDSYISICKQYQKRAVLELKSNFSQDEIAEMIEIIQNLDYVYGVTFISFNYDNLLYVRNVLPNQKVQYLFSNYTDEILERLVRDDVDVAISYKELTKELLKTFHDAGLEVNCWTVDDKKTANKLASWGVDYITTNILE